jgi:hypothetical protein
MSAALDGVRVKIDRAETHLETVLAEVTRVVGPNAYRIVKAQQNDRTEYVYRVEGLQTVRTDLSAIVGDCLHNLRSALDHIADGVIRRAGLDPTRRTMFPIQISEPTGGLHINPAPGPGSVAMAVVESVQPYAAGSGGAHPLLFLDELNRVDKHRELLFALTALSSGAWGLPLDMPSPRRRYIRRPIKDGDEIAWFEFAHPWPKHPEPEFDPELLLSIRLRPPTGFSMPSIVLHPLEELMSSMFWNVAHWIVPQFEPFLT